MTFDNIGGPLIALACVAIAGGLWLSIIIPVDKAGTWFSRQWRDLTDRIHHRGDYDLSGMADLFIQPQQPSQYEEAMFGKRPGPNRAPYPHCDPYVLHAPGQCEFCDEFPDQQQERMRICLNFTGRNRADYAPCPSEVRRPLETINRWPGNRPSPGADRTAIYGTKRITLDRMWRDPSMRSRFESETGWPPLHVNSNEDAEGFRDLYEAAFNDWAHKRLV